MSVDSWQRVLSTSVVHPNGWPRFDREAILRESSLLVEAAQELSRLVDPEVDAICALAVSGLPLGTVVAQILGKPLVFHRKKPLAKDGSGKELYTLPRPRSGWDLALIDFNVREGHTSSKANLSLTDCGAGVKQVVALLDCWPNESRPHPLPNAQLVTLRQLARDPAAFCSLFGLADTDDITRIDGGFWKRHRVGSIASKPDEQVNLDNSSRSLIVPWKVAAPRLLDGNIKRLLDSYIPKDPLGHWHLFADPTRLAAACRLSGERLGLDEYDVIAGNRLVGGALAMALAYHAGFRGALAIHLPEYGGILPSPRDWENQRVLLCQGDLSGGKRTVDAYKAISNAGARVTDVLFARTQKRVRLLPISAERDRLRQLVLAGVNLWRLS